MIQRRRFSILSLLIVVSSLIWGVLSVQALDKETLNAGLRASVKLIILDENLDAMGGCSGTILNDEGYILTNYHCVGHTDLYGEDKFLEHGELFHPDGILVVGLTTNPRKLPVPSYYAQYVSGNPDQDVAVIKIVADIDGNDVAETLPLVTATLIDSDLVDLGEEVSVLGYPGVGGDTVTLTEGKVAGFIDDDNDGLTDWFKTDALINGGNSGGTAVNGQGEMVGIPSASLFDADRGDSLFFIKPINQAYPVIEQALQAGDSVGGFDTSEQTEPSGSENTTIASGENFGEIFFGVLGDDSFVPIEEVTGGVSEVTAEIPFTDMRDGTTWSYMWYYEGQELFGEERLRWDFGESGFFTLSLWHNDSFLASGDYLLEVILRGRVARDGHFTLGSTDSGAVSGPKKPPAKGQKGVLLTGLVLDYDTERPIEDALVIILKPGLDTEDFDAADDVDTVVLSVGVTDVDGIYTTETPLPREQSYTAIIGRRGYERVAYDFGLEVTADDPDLIEMADLFLERR
ncbi:MAG: serine protease [Chloroflexota bacterium]